MTYLAKFLKKGEFGLIQRGTRLQDIHLSDMVLWSFAEKRMENKVIILTSTKIMFILTKTQRTSDLLYCVKTSFKIIIKNGGSARFEIGRITSNSTNGVATLAHAWVVSQSTLLQVRMWQGVRTWYSSILIEWKELSGMSSTGMMKKLDKRLGWASKVS